MNTLQLAGNERAVANERYYDTEISKANLTGIESAGKSNFEIYANEEGLKKLLQPFNVFKTISRDDFEKWDIDLLLEYTKMHHGFAGKNAAVIYEQAQKVFYRECKNHPELITLTEVIFLFLHDLLNQMGKEELFFSCIRQIAAKKRHKQISVNYDSQSLDDILKSFENGREKALNYLKVIRQITCSYKIPADACNSHKFLFEKLMEFEEGLILHFHIQKEFLFPKAVALADKNTKQGKNAEVIGL